VPWLRGHFLGLVEKSLANVDPDPKRFLEALRRVADGIRTGNNPLDEGGIVALIATPEQKAALDQISGMMSLLEGHGDVTMDRAGADRIPSADRFSRVLRQRRQQVSGPARMLQRLIGLEAKMNQYEQGERFIHSVEEQGGPDMLDNAWRGAEFLPTLSEIRSPREWVARVRLAGAVA
jgi:putative hydrolase